MQSKFWVSVNAKQHNIPQTQTIFIQYRAGEEKLRKVKIVFLCGFS